MNEPIPSKHNPHLFFVLGDITELKVDAMVNAANNRLLQGSGVCGAIFKKAGPELSKACGILGYCETGDAVTTPGFNSLAKKIIHTVGPMGIDKDRAGLLKSCYIRSIEEALDADCRSIAFPAISTGIYGYPLREAAEVAYRTSLDQLGRHPGILDIYLVSFDEDSLKIYLSLDANHIKKHIIE